jgi:hypothetical protein
MESRNVQKMELQECQCWETTPSQTTRKSCGCSTVQLSDGGREGKYEGNKLNGVKTCPKDWSVLLLLVQLKGLQRCKMLGNDTPATEKVDTQRCSDLWEARS